MTATVIISSYKKIPLSSFMIGQATKNTSAKKKQKKANSFMRKNYQYIFICCQSEGWFQNPDAGQCAEKRGKMCDSQRQKEVRRKGPMPPLIAAAQLPHGCTSIQSSFTEKRGKSSSVGSWHQLTRLTRTGRPYSALILGKKGTIFGAVTSSSAPSASTTMLLEQ